MSCPLLYPRDLVQDTDIHTSLRAAPERVTEPLKNREVRWLKTREESGQSMVPEEGARRSDLAGGAEKPLLHRPAGRRRSAVHQRQK